MITLIEMIFGSKIGRILAEIALGLLLLSCTVLYLEHRGAAKVMAKLEKSSDQVKQDAKDEIDRNNRNHAAEVKTNVDTTKAAVGAANALSAALDLSVRNFDAYRRAHPAVASAGGGSAATGLGECGAQSCGDLASAALQDGDQLTGSNAELSGVLQGCQRERDALTGLPK